MATSTERRLTQLEKLRDQVDKLRADQHGFVKLDKQELVELANLGVEAAVDAQLYHNECKALEKEMDERGYDE